MTEPLPTFLVLREAGACLVADLSEARLPQVLHWGADLGDLTRADLDAMALSAVRPWTPNLTDQPVRVGILPEASSGWSGRPGLIGSRRGRDFSPRFTVHQVLLDGEPVTQDVVTCGTGAVTVRAHDATAQLGLDIVVEMLTGGVLRTRAALFNHSAEEDYTLDSLLLALPVPSLASELMDFAGRWGLERAPQRRDFVVGTHLRENRRGRTGADSAYLLQAGTTGFGFEHGEVWAVHTAWSGNHIHYAERLASGEQVIGGGELLMPGEVVLGGGESHRSPWLYAGHGQGQDALARRFHRYLRSRDPHPHSPRPVTLNVWEAVYFDHSLQPLLKLAETAAELGVERYVLDDGWFGSRRDDTSGLGDWQVSPEVWPDGLHPLVNRVKELGMQFGLWFEPEMVNPDSEVARAHPEWIMAADPQRWPVESRSQQVINLGIEECFEYVRDAILAILDEYAIDYIKWDHNRDLVEAGDQLTGRPGVHAQTLAFYRLLDEIHEAHPELEIESCSSGGARVDLEVLQRTQRVWVSDCIDPHDRQQMMRWTSQLIPLELMGSHIASGVSHTTGRHHDLDFRAATALFGHLGIEWDLRRASDDERTQLRAWIEFYRQHRGLLHSGDLVRIDHPETSVVASGVVAPDQSRALFSIAVVDRADVASLGAIRLPGLDPQRRYRVSPQMLDHPASGLRPPAWWGVTRDLSHELEDLHEGRQPRLVAEGEPGVVMTGRMLAQVGVMDAPVNPDHAVILLAEAID